MRRHALRAPPVLARTRLGEHHLLCALGLERHGRAPAAVLLRERLLRGCERAGFRSSSTETVAEVSGRAASRGARPWPPGRALALDQAWYFDEAAGRECQSRLVAGKPDAWEDARAEMSAETKRMTGRRPPPASRRDGTQRSDHRLAYLDNLKVLLVVGVIAVHTAIIYGVDGSFYLEDYDSMVDVSVGLLTIFTGVGFLFGLGAFFLIAGRLSGPSLDRKGPRRFVRDRLLRLGIPVLFYVALIAPVMEYVKYRDEGGTDGFLTIAGDQALGSRPGPTWFLEALLVFSLAYALLRALRPRPGRPRRSRCAGARSPRWEWRSRPSPSRPTSSSRTARSTSTSSSRSSRSTRSCSASAVPPGGAAGSRRSPRSFAVAAA